MILAIASGKGGTGKTTLAVNLARAYGEAIQLMDCDVEEPNAHLFLRGGEPSEEVVTLPVPEFDEALCDSCGECGRFCVYHAILAFLSKPVLIPEMCHSCGGCTLVCPRKAIREVERRIGAVQEMQSDNIRLVTGKLDIGSPLSPPLIRAVKRRLREGTPAIVDAPPGTSCPVIAAVRGADFVVLVTEPTPFGLHDLTLAVETMRILGIPFGVAVNRMGIGDGRVHDYCAREGIEILLEIPDDRRIAEAYSRGELLVDALPEYGDLFRGLSAKLLGAGNLTRQAASGE
ncbi:MAG: ATP-binding protein [Anaerolineales bacterium]|nr:ATP-binding protein [Anaerolineales bacterium]